MADFLLGFAVLASVIALGLAAYALRRAERPLVHSALVELADQRNLLEKLLTARHNAARAANVAEARSVKEQRRSLVEEAAAVIAAQGGEGTPATAAPRSVAQLPRGGGARSQDQLLIELRKRAWGE